MKKFAWYAVGVVVVLSGIATFLIHAPQPEKISYGASFTKLYADELRLDWKEVYRSMLDDLGVRKLRLAAHWPMIEPERDVYDFSAMDFQIREASKRDAEVILAVGRRLPRWPECHTPTWVGSMEWDEQKMEIRQYLTAIIERYKGETAITYWQVENEPYLHAFAGHICGELDEDFLMEEIALVKELDPSRRILVTDSGNLGTWYRPYRAGDAFGTSVYVHFWTPELGPFRTVQPAELYRVKANLMRLFFGEKPTLLIELSGEPWLIESVRDVPLETQLSRMDVAKFDDILAYARDTHFDEQYLWGIEWWYWMKQKGYPEFWDRAQELFQ